MNKQSFPTSALRFSLLVTVYCLIAAGVFAQNPGKCRTNEVRQKHYHDHPEYRNESAAIERFTQDWITQSSANKTNTVLTIPVVVHVVYRNASQNISDAQVQSQIQVLNDDFRRQNTDASQTPAQFRSVAADCEIEFCLASRDPQGNATNGITRTQTSVANIGDTPANNGGYAKVYFNSEGGKDAWDSNRYMNIWVCEIDASGSLLGYASPPGTSPASEDGCVIDYKFFGTIGTAANSSPNHLGRTATHEVGHYLNLEHIWGLDGGCNDDDLVADTPSQEYDNWGCPSLGAGSSSCGSQDMFMNYMDYVDDPCMNIFTQGQKSRMQAALNGPRSGLLTSNGCGGQIASVTPTLNAFDQVRVYPNPSNGILYIDGLPQYRNNITVQVIDLQGRLIRKQNLANMEVQELNLSDCSGGLYFVEVGQGDDRTVKKIVIAH